jgi:hypothetical protein
MLSLHKPGNLSVQHEPFYFYQDFSSLFFSSGQLILATWHPSLSILRRRSRIGLDKNCSPSDHPAQTSCLAASPKPASRAPMQKEA